MNCTFVCAFSTIQKNLATTVVMHQAKFFWCNCFVAMSWVLLWVLSCSDKMHMAIPGESAFEVQWSGIVNLNQIFTGKYICIYIYIYIYSPAKKDKILEEQLHPNELHYFNKAKIKEKLYQTVL